MMTPRIRAALVAVSASASMLLTMFVPVAAQAAGVHSVTATNASFATAARAAGYTPRQIALIEKHHAQNSIPVRFTRANTKVGADHAPTGGMRAMDMAATITSCWTDKGTSYAKNVMGDELLSFTVSVRFCVRINQPPRLPGSRVVSHWSAQIVNEHLSHHTFSMASIGGWSYQGLDSSGNWGPTITRNHGLTAQRRAHWHYHIGWGPASVNHNWYPWVKFSLDNNGGGWIYRGGSS